MKQFNSFLTRLLVIATLQLPWATAEALETFQQAGVISKVNSATINIHYKDINYRIGAKTEFRFQNVAKPDTSSFKKGDEVYLRGKIVNGAYYVDVVIYMPKVPG